MARENNQSLTIYGNGISALLTISTAGLAAATALMKITEMESNVKPYYLVAIGLFSVGLFLCFFALCGLSGQASQEKPDLFVGNVRLPSIIAFLVDAVAFGILVWFSYFSSPGSPNSRIVPIVQQLELCRSETMTNQQARLQCYDSLFDSELEKSITLEDTLRNSTTAHRRWFKLLMLKLSKSE